MKRVLISFFLISTIAVCVVYAIQLRFPAPKSPDEIWQNDRDLDQAINTNQGLFDTKLVIEFQTTVPKSVGKAYYCTNCTVAVVCVSTGTLIGQFSSMAAKTTNCT